MIKFDMRVHPKGLIVLLIFFATFGLALDMRLGIIATVAAAIIEWLYIGVLVWPRQRTRLDPL